MIKLGSTGTVLTRLDKAKRFTRVLHVIHKLLIWHCVRQRGCGLVGSRQTRGGQAGKWKTYQKTTTVQEGREAELERERRTRQDRLWTDRQRYLQPCLWWITKAWQTMHLHIYSTAWFWEGFGDAPRNNNAEFTEFSLWFRTY